MKYFDAISQLSSDGPLTLVVDGDCMFNTVPDGSKVRIERRAYYWPGDVVVYGRGDDRLVMHRFLGYVPCRSGWCGMTRADEADKADAPMPARRILGKVLYIDQVSSRPGIRKRIRSLLRYPVAVISWAGGKLVRFLKSMGVLR